MAVNDLSIALGMGGYGLVYLKALFNLPPG